MYTSGETRIDIIPSYKNFAVVNNNGCYYLILRASVTHISKAFQPWNHTSFLCDLFETLHGHNKARHHIKSYYGSAPKRH